ncbi:uncharacterized protein LOC118436997 [Folsomia candida]|nr:uncharacterized protein LOC118436997 [Folsomia candida]
MYYVLLEMKLTPNNMTNLVFRTVLFALSWTEVCRLIAIPICLVLWTINVARREMFMWGNMARRSNLGGHFYYRQIAILYTLRRRPTTFVLSFIVITGFIYEVLLNYATIVMFGVFPISVYWTLPYIAIVVRIIVTQVVDIAAQTYEDFDATLKFMRRKCFGKKSYMFRKLRGSQNLGLCIYLGTSPYLIKNSLKIDYRTSVLYYTVSLLTH